MFEVIDDLLAEYAELGTRLADPSVHADADVARKLGKRYAELGPIAETYREYQAVGGDIDRRRGARRRGPGLRRGDPGAAGAPHRAGGAAAASC